MVVPKELLEAVLDSLPEGVWLMGEDHKVLFWNRAAETATGFSAMDLIGRDPPDALAPLISSEIPKDYLSEDGLALDREKVVRIYHKFGYPIHVETRMMVLRDELGGRIGMACIFRATENVQALPHGSYEGDEQADADRKRFEERLAATYKDFIDEGTPFGVLWISVDQAQALHRTHGDMAFRNMLAKIGCTLSLGLRPNEEMTRWGDGEFLVISHERTAEMLGLHAQTFVGLARTTDFQWWGDRVTLSVSVGAAQANRGESLCDLLDRAQRAVEVSSDAGGNQFARAAGRPACLPS